MKIVTDHTYPPKTIKNGKTLLQSGQATEYTKLYCIGPPRVIFACVTDLGPQMPKFSIKIYKIFHIGVT